MEYTVEVTDFVKNITLFNETCSNANSAYSLYRELTDLYREIDTVQVVLHEPE